MVCNQWDKINVLNLLRIAKEQGWSYESEECGRPMIEGFVVDGCDTYCSDKCLHEHLTDEEFNSLYDDGNGDTYWTTWYEDSETYRTNNDKDSSYVNCIR